MLLWSLVMLSIILLWKNAQWEWDIPPKFQTFLQNKKNDLSQGTRRLRYDWKEFKGKELEKSFADLKRESSRLRRKDKVSFRIEVYLPLNIMGGTRKKYLACLQRRFPDIEICSEQQSESSVE
jgi:hypothetical protein